MKRKELEKHEKQVKREAQEIKAESIPSNDPSNKMKTTKPSAPSPNDLRRKNLEITKAHDLHENALKMIASKNFYDAENALMAAQALASEHDVKPLLASADILLAFTIFKLNRFDEAQASNSSNYSRI